MFSENLEFDRRTFMLLKGLTAVIVGGSGGLGLEIGRTLSGEGARIVIMDRNVESCEAGVSALKKDGISDAAAIVVEISSPESVAHAFATLDEQIGKFDILINSAGVREVKNVFDLEPAEWDKVIAINLSGPFYCSREAAKRLSKTGGGAIVNIASVAALIGITHRPAYTASKHGIVGLTRNLAKDLASFNIRVNAVAPGTVRTPMTEAYYSDEAFVRGMEQVVPLGSKGTVRDVANAVLFLSSPMSNFITGVILPVDGGWSSEKSYAVGGTQSAYTSAASSRMVP
jgi:NAD(P)-dependent dehydrogenase (short-subunit alcohol dehydrogenase family)